MGGRYDIMQRVKEMLEASDPLNYGNAEQSRTIEISPAPQLSPDPRIEALANSPYLPPAPPPVTIPPAPGVSITQGQEEVVALLRDGHKIMAVKRYRELTGVGLAEAKAAIDALEQRLDAASAPAAPDMDALAARVVGLVQGGNKIEAIKVYREATNVGLREAKDAVETIEARLRQSQQPAPFAAPPPPPPVDPLLGPRQTIPDWLTPVVEQLRRGNKIQAIKAYRAATGVGLAEAKDTVEALERQLASKWRG
jgi:ribosomal protein L7/L12